MNWTDSPIGKRVNDYGTVVGLLDSFSFADMPNDNLPVMVEWTGKTAATLHVRLKEPLDENLARLNEEMHRIYPQKSLVFRSVEQEMRSYAESVRVFRDVTLLVSLTILFIILMGLIGYVNDEIRLRSKEIAIRKVNGAETESILLLLSRDVLWLAIPSVAIGIGEHAGPESFGRASSLMLCHSYRRIYSCRLSVAVVYRCYRGVEGMVHCQ